MDVSKKSFVALVGENASTCGYCHSKQDTSKSYGIWAYKLTCQDYQDLIDLGWRRSGKYLYKPNVQDTCCPPFTIRLDVTQYTPNKSHKKTIKRMRGYLTEDKGATRGNQELQQQQDVDAPSEACQGKQPVHHQTGVPMVHSEKTTDTMQMDISVLDKDTHMKERPPSKHPSNAPVEFLPFIQHAEQAGKHQLKVVLQPAKFEKETFELYCKYQTLIHKDTPDKLSPGRYKEFLVDSPLQFEPPKLPHETGFGSFHQKYYMDDKLIAVGIIDILPFCVSSVYLIYDPDYSFLSLGVYSALREIAFTKMLHQHLPLLKYYYMGYYIHSCPKMRYKAQYKPSDLLCPEQYVWLPISQVVSLLDKKCLSLCNPENPSTRKPEVKAQDLAKCLFLQGNTLYDYTASS